MNKYIVHAGCSIYSEYYPVVGDIKEVEHWAYQTAIEEFDSYAGLHGLMDFNEFCDDIGYEAWEEYADYREGELVYYIEPFDETKETHLDYLEWNGGEFIEV